MGSDECQRCSCPIGLFLLPVGVAEPHFSRGLGQAEWKRLKSTLDRVAELAG